MLVMAQAGLERERLKQQEHMLVLQLNHEQEKEAHQFWMLQMQFAMHNPALGNNIAFNMGLSNVGLSNDANAGQSYWLFK